MWDPASGVGFVFYTQLEFRATPACEDFVGAITAQVFGALRRLRVGPARRQGARSLRKARL
jgi:hypothetical protein